MQRSEHCVLMVDAAGSLAAVPEGTAVILVVEDEVLPRLAIAESLRDGGYHVVEAGDGEEAQVVLRAGTMVDLVFSDVQLPGEGDGFELARWIREQWPAIPVILTSGIAEVARNARAAGHDGPVVPKPYSHQEVVQRIQELLCAKRTGVQGRSPTVT